MNDPYIQGNGTLKNLLGIFDSKELKQAEADITFANLIKISDVIKNEDSNVKLLKDIHRYIFKDIYEWAGEFRTVPIYKTETIIPGISLEYSQPKNIEKDLINRIHDLNQCRWKNLTINEISKQFSHYLARIWRVHPFREGNTRTTLAFANIFAKQQGFELNLGVLLDDSKREYSKDTAKVAKWGIRDKFVLAALDEENYPEPQMLENIIRKAINENNKFKKLNNKDKGER